MGAKLVLSNQRATVDAFWVLLDTLSKWLSDFLLPVTERFAEVLAGTPSIEQLSEQHRIRPGKRAVSNLLRLRMLI